MNSSTKTEGRRNGDAEKSQDNFAATAPSVSLPQGGGAIQSIGEKFAANLVAGIAGITISFGLTGGRPGCNPGLALACSSAVGNGPFGVGWQFKLASTQRITFKGLPLCDPTGRRLLQAAEVRCERENDNAQSPAATPVTIGQSKHGGTIQGTGEGFTANPVGHTSRIKIPLSLTNGLSKLGHLEILPTSLCAFGAICEYPEAFRDRQSGDQAETTAPIYPIVRNPRYT
jgi:hypothetical protein